MTEIFSSFPIPSVPLLFPMVSWQRKRNRVFFLHNMQASLRSVKWVHTQGFNRSCRVLQFLKQWLNRHVKRSLKDTAHSANIVSIICRASALFSRRCYIVWTSTNVCHCFFHSQNLWVQNQGEKVWMIFTHCHFKRSTRDIFVSCSNILKPDWPRSFSMKEKSTPARRDNKHSTELETQTSL